MKDFCNSGIARMCLADRTAPTSKTLGRPAGIRRGILPGAAGVTPLVILAAKGNSMGGDQHFRAAPDAFPGRMPGKRHRRAKPPMEPPCNMDGHPRYRKEFSLGFLDSQPGAPGNFLADRPRATPRGISRELPSPGKCFSRGGSGISIFGISREAGCADRKSPGYPAGFGRLSPFW